MLFHNSIYYLNKDKHYLHVVIVLECFLCVVPSVCLGIRISVPK